MFLFFFFAWGLQGTVGRITYTLFVVMKVYLPDLKKKHSATMLLQSN